MTTFETESLKTRRLRTAKRDRTKLTHLFEEAFVSRAVRDHDFGVALLDEALRVIQGGEADIGKELINDYINGEIAAAMLPLYNQPAIEGWKVHDGGGCPIGLEERVKTKHPFIDGAEFECAAKLYRWDRMRGVPYLHVPMFAGEIRGFWFNDEYKDLSSESVRSDETPC